MGIRFLRCRRFKRKTRTDQPQDELAESYNSRVARLLVGNIDAKGLPILPVRLTRRIPLLIFAVTACVAVAAFWWVVAGRSSEFGTAARWLVRSDEYKARVLAQPDSTNGELKHVEWDGWGWAGQNTTVYLVFDPADSLYQAASRHLPGKYSGIPCEVFLVRRLESHWYTVQFYTSQDWRRSC